MEKGTLIGLSVCRRRRLPERDPARHQHRVPLHGDSARSSSCSGLHRRDDRSRSRWKRRQNVAQVHREGDEGQRRALGEETIAQIVKLTNRARSEGLLALEDEAKSIEDPFFRKGIEFAVDGTDPEALKKTLNSEIGAMKERHKVGQGWFTQAGVFAPTFGIIGAVFGLMATMAHLVAPDEGR